MLWILHVICSVVCPFALLKEASHENSSYGRTPLVSVGVCQGNVQHFEVAEAGDVSRSTEEGDDDAEVLIECRDVYKSFGEKHILRGASFKVNFT